MNEANTTLINTLNEYIQNVKDKRVEHYIITVSRDGETPPRSLISFYTRKEALEGYEKYQDAGFAEQILTVSLYEPSGKINTKILIFWIIIFGHVSNKKIKLNVRAKWNKTFDLFSSFTQKAICWKFFSCFCYIHY